MNILTDKAPLLKARDIRTWFPVKRGIFSKTVGHVRAVDGVSFDIYKGMTLGLVGESGCGKTTLGRTLLGLEKIRSGSVVFLGKLMTGAKRSGSKKLRRKMQMIFQDSLLSLNPRMNVLDIVTEALVEFGMIKGDRKSRAIELLADVGLDESGIYQYPHEFSGGQRQRINIARAISMKPDFIICDEMVSALDVSVQARVVNLMLDLSKTFGLSYLFISHDLSVVSNIADNIAVMYLGKFVEYGATADIMGSPRHPYTKALISAVLTPESREKGRIVLRGETPSPISPPSGCGFHTRCPEAMEICRNEMPEESKKKGRKVWCHLCK